MSTLTETLAAAAASLALIAALAACSPAADAAGAAAEPTASRPPVVSPAAPTDLPEQSAQPTTVAQPAECQAPGRFSIMSTEGGPTTSTLEGKPRDFGPAYGATGTVEVDANGTPTAYVVAPGDAGSAIEKRLCFDLILLHNGVDALQPDMRLSLTADGYRP